MVLGHFLYADYEQVGYTGWFRGLYVHIWGLRSHGHFNVDTKLSWFKFVHIIYFESLKYFHQQKYNIPIQHCKTILLSYGSITL